MKKIIALSFVFLFIFSCSKVPITGRKQFKMLPESEIMSLSLTEYRKVLSNSKVLPVSDPRTAQVKRIGERISRAATTYLNANGYAKRVEGYTWEFNVIDENTLNAWCMPGGKVAFYTGILPTCLNDDGIATVMGHEIAHAIARHGNERMSQSMAIQVGSSAVSVAMNQQPELTRNILLQSVGVGSTLGMLAFSRKHELEADQLGLVFMALAGYNPSKAADFWKRMDAIGGAKPPEFLSTHPNDGRRIEEINKFLPKAMKYYKPQ